MKITPLELVVIEGGGKHTRFLLNHARVVLGRLDPGESPTAGNVLFPEPTVSKIHAVLDWDPKKHRYLITHRSTTNATVINGTHLTRPIHVNPGDRIKMGRLMFELRIGKGQHADGEVASVDLGRLTREAAATAPETELWIGDTPIPRAPTLPSVTDAPAPERIPPPVRKSLPTPNFDQPYQPIPVVPAEPVRAEPVPAPTVAETATISGESLLYFADAEELVPAVTQVPRRIALPQRLEVPEAVAEPEPEAVAEPEPEAVAEPEPEAVKPAVKQQPYRRATRKIGRNEKCPCGSGLKYKKCCGR